MNLRQLFGINDNKIDWRFPFIIGFALIIPQLVLISFVIIGRLIIKNHTGIFSNEFLYEPAIGIVSYIILILCLIIFLSIRKIPIIISIILATVFCRIPNLLEGMQILFVVIFLLTDLLFFVLIDKFLQRFKNSIKGLIIIFLLTTLLNKILVNIAYVILFYRQFGFEMITFNVENGVFLKKLISYLAGGLVLTLLFGLSLLILNRLVIKNKQYS